MSRRPKLTPRDLMRAQRERRTAQGIACGRYTSVMGYAGVVVDVPGPRGVVQAHLAPGVALRFAWGVIRYAVGAWWANVREGKRNA